MWITFAIAASFVVAMIAMVHFGFDRRDEALDALEAIQPSSTAPGEPGRCGLCRAPLRRSLTRDEIVFELEHRIDAELRDISRALRSAPEGFGRIFHA